MKKVLLATLISMSLTAPIRAQSAHEFVSACELFAFKVPSGWAAGEDAKTGRVSVKFAADGQIRAAMQITYGDTKLFDEPIETQKKALRDHAQALEAGAMLRKAMPEMTVYDGVVEEIRVGPSYAVQRRYTAADTSGNRRDFVYIHTIQNGLWLAISYSCAGDDAAAISDLAAMLNSFKFS